MVFAKKTIRDIELKNKRVLLHGELDAPLDDEGTKVTSDFRIQSNLPTIRYLQKQGCPIVIISKLGRPGGKRDVRQTLRPVAERLSKLLNQKVQFVDDCIGQAVKEACANLQPGQIIVLENIRFYPEEEKNDKTFAKKIVDDTGCEVFVQDCFALAHRKEAGTDAITHLLPSVAGFNLEKEVTTIMKVMDNPKRPLLAIIGGAKISDKIEMLRRFIDIADFVAVGGAMANTFLLAEGIKIGKSHAEPKDIPVAKEIIAAAKAKAKRQQFTFYIPQDGVVAKALDKSALTRIVDWDAHVIADIENYPKQPPRNTGEVSSEESIYDIGPFSGAFIAGGVQLAQTVIWNGAMGVTETAGLQGPVGPFAHGTETVIEALLGEFGNRPFSVLGGGDTVGYIEDRGLEHCFNHVSTGGGASLELMAEKKLPGVEALMDKSSGTIKT